MKAAMGETARRLALLMALLAVSPIAAKDSFKPLRELDADDVQSLLASWKLDRVFGPGFRKAQVNGDLLSLAETRKEIADSSHFPMALPVHFKKLWREIQTLQEAGGWSVSHQDEVSSSHANMVSSDLGGAPKRVRRTLQAANGWFAGIQIQKEKASLEMGPKGDVKLLRPSLGHLDLVAQNISINGTPLGDFIRMETGVCTVAVDVSKKSNITGTGDCPKFLPSGSQCTLSCKKGLRAIAGTKCLNGKIVEHTKCALVDMRTCQEFYDAGARKSGLYELTFTGKPQKFWCNMETQGGAWMLMARAFYGDGGRKWTRGGYGGQPDVGTATTKNKDKVYKIADAVVNVFFDNECVSNHEYREMLIQDTTKNTMLHYRLHSSWDATNADGSRPLLQCRSNHLADWSYKYSAMGGGGWGEVCGVCSKLWFLIFVTLAAYTSSNRVHTNRVNRPAL